MFFTDDVQADYDQRALGAEFTEPPKDLGYAKIAILRDGCGNLVQVSQLKKW